MMRLISCIVLLSSVFVYSLIKIRKDSGSWKEFNPFYSGFGVYMMFVMSSFLLLAAIVTAFIKLA